MDDEDITKRTCPVCKGSGTTVTEKANATGYSIHYDDCWFCDTHGAVTEIQYAEYARVYTRMER